MLKHLTLAGCMCLTLGTVGCSEGPSAPEHSPSAREQSARKDAAEPLGKLTNEDVLRSAEREIRKMGLTLPDEQSKKALGGLGFVPKVAAIENGWHVTYPLGNPWAMSYVELDVDSTGLLRHSKLTPGQ